MTKNKRCKGSKVVPSALPDEPRSRIAIRPSVDPVVARTIGLVRRRGVTLTPVAQHFLRTVRRMAPELQRESTEYSQRLAQLSLAGAK